MIDLAKGIADMFALYTGILDSRSDHHHDGERSVWSYMHTGTPKDVGIRVRRVGRDPGYKEAKLAYDREYMRRKRATAKKQPKEHPRRQQVMLLVAEGKSTSEISRVTGVHRRTIAGWRNAVRSS